MFHKGEYEARDVTSTRRLMERAAVRVESRVSPPPAARLVVPGALKGPHHRNSACSGQERRSSAAGKLTEVQAKDAGMGWWQGTREEAAVPGSRQDVPGFSRGRAVRGLGDSPLTQAGTNTLLPLTS